LDGESRRSGSHPAGDFAAIGDEDFGEHGSLS